MQKDSEYINSLKKYILAAAGIFFFMLIIGVLVSELNPASSGYLLEMMKKAFSTITSLDPFSRMIEIFKNNVRNSLLALVLGTGLGIVPFIVAAANGLVLGMLTDFVSRQQGALFVLAAIIPHGIIEVPMVLISVGIGFRLGHVVYMFLNGVRTDIKLEMMQGIWFYVRWVVPLLFVAAFIESYVTPLIAMRFAGL
ncbi:Stage II sporulation protein M [uncultured archaeon]|nr:Stage II sporulation protein M [uncultured archaeon]